MQKRRERDKKSGSKRNSLARGATPHATWPRRACLPPACSPLTRAPLLPPPLSNDETTYPIEVHTLLPHHHQPPAQWCSPLEARFNRGTPERSDIFHPSYYRWVSTTPYRYRTSPRRTVPYRIASYRIVPYRIVTVPHRIVPYRTIPYRTVPYLAQVQVRQAVPQRGLVSGTHGAEGNERQMLEDHEGARPDFPHPVASVHVPARHEWQEQKSRRG